MFSNARFLSGQKAHLNPLSGLDPPLLRYPVAEHVHREAHPHERQEPEQHVPELLEADHEGAADYGAGYPAYVHGGEGAYYRRIRWSGIATMEC